MKTFSDAWRGIVIAFQSERNVKIHFVLTILVILFAIIFQLNSIEWCMILLAIGLVISSEMMNTAIEKLVDYFSLEKNLKARNIKDIAAGAVLINAIVALFIAAFIFIPKLYEFLRNYF